MLEVKLTTRSGRNGLHVEKFVRPVSPCSQQYFLFCAAVLEKNLVLHLLIFCCPVLRQVLGTGRHVSAGDVGVLA